MNKRDSVYRLLNMLGAILPAILGLSVLLGWYTHNILLIQVSAELVPMQYNTALGFLFAGIGLIAVLLKRSTISLVIGCFVSLLGLLTIMQYIFGIDFGIDQLMMKHYITTQTSHPGRMAPNTALCFMLTGVVLIQSSNLFKNKNFNTSVAILGTLVTCFGLIAITGYMFSIEAAYGWGGWTRMAVHTSIGFIIIGITIISHAWQNSIRSKFNLPIWLPVLSGISVLTIMLFLWKWSDAIEHGLKEDIHLLSNMILIIGLVLSLSIALLIYFAQLIKNREADLIDVNTNLRKQICEREDSEANLKISNDKLKLVLDSTDVGVWDWDIENHNMKFNQRWAEIFGYDYDELSSIEDMNLWWKENAHPDDYIHAAKLLEQHWRGETEYNVSEHRMLHKQGHWIWVYDAGKVIEWDKEDKPVRMIGTFMDITDRKNAEEKLRESNERFKNAYSEAAIGMILVSLEHKIIDSNNAFVDMVGYSNEELIGVKSVDITHPDDIEISKKLHNKLVNNEIDKYHLEKRYLNKQGEVVWCSLSVSAVRDENNTPIYFVAQIQDITARKKIETILQENIEKYRTLTELSPYCIHQIDIDGNFISMNKAGLDMLGLKYEKEIIGVPYLESVCDDDRGRIANLMQKALTNGKQSEFKFQSTSGMFFQSNFVPIYNKNNEIDRLLGITQDITDARVLERQLIQSQKMEAVGHLTGGIAHDFNNILTAVLGYSYMMEEELQGKDESKLIRYLQHVITGGIRAQHLVKELLLFSSHGDKKKENVLISTIVNDTTELLKGILPSSIELNINIDHVHDYYISTNPIQLEQAIMNLCINAKDAMHGKGLLTININKHHNDDRESGFPFEIINDKVIRSNICFCENNAAHSGEFVELSINDTGDGMTSDVLTHLFEPFFTNKETGEGTGLGLATVHGFMESVSGHIIVETIEGQGTLFRLFFRITDVVDNNELLDISSAEKKSSIVKNNELTDSDNNYLLIVDDEKDICNLMQDAFSMYGYNVRTSANGEEALKLFKSSPDKFAMVITDQTMPKLTGIELAKEILLIRSEIPIILCTGYSEVVNEEIAIDCGIKRFINKPVSPQQLLDIVNESLIKVA